MGNENQTKSKVFLSGCLKDLEEAIATLLSNVIVPPVSAEDAEDYNFALAHVATLIRQIEAIDAICEEFGGVEHTTWRRLYWSEEVIRGDTILGYWEWVLHKDEETRKFYAVRIRVQIGEYQKAVTRVVKAGSEKDACRIALLDECHDADESNLSEDGESVEDLNGEMLYTVRSVSELTEEAAGILKAYL